jgi:hypothetical protein
MKKNLLNEQISRIKGMMGKINEGTYEENQQQNNDFFDKYKNMDWNQRREWSKQKRHNELNNRKQELGTSHFSGGSVQEDLGVLSGKVGQLINDSDTMGARVKAIIDVVDIHMRDSVEMDSDVYDQLYTIKNEMEDFYSELSDFDNKIDVITKQLEELSDPSHRSWRGDEDDYEPQDEPKKDMPGFEGTQDNLDALTIREQQDMGTAPIIQKSNNGPKAPIVCPQGYSLWTNGPNSFFCFIDNPKDGRGQPQGGAKRVEVPPVK